MNNKSELHKSICSELTETYIKKNQDYGDSFHELYKELGTMSALTQIVHKTNRLKSIIMNQKILVNNESVRDTVMDLANYCILFAMELEKGGNNGTNQEIQSTSIQR